MPKSKTQKRLEVLEKLEEQLKDELAMTSIKFIGYMPRHTMLLSQINNLRNKLQMGPYKEEV